MANTRGVIKQQKDIFTCSYYTVKLVHKDNRREQQMWSLYTGDLYMQVQ